MKKRQCKKDDRPTTIFESIIQSCNEVVLMREGKLPKKKIRDFLNEFNEHDYGHSKIKLERYRDDYVKEENTKCKYCGEIAQGDYRNENYDPIPVCEKCFNIIKNI